MKTGSSKEKGQGTFRSVLNHNNILHLRFLGKWTLTSVRPGLKEIVEQIQATIASSAAKPCSACIDASGITVWDSSFAAIFQGVMDFLGKQAIPIERTDLPEEFQAFMSLVKKGLSPAPVEKQEISRDIATLTGKAAIGIIKEAMEFIRFTGEISLAFWNTVRGKAHLNRNELLLVIQDAGADSLAIISIVSFLVGVILAFVGTVQLQQFGAEIYVANLVGIAMARDMSAMMCGIIVAGRTGASYAAAIGTMQVNEEIDALKTLGINPVEYLVIPRIVALGTMAPLLVIYSNIVGLAGGAAVGTGLTTITLTQFIEQTILAVPLTHFIIGVIKATVYGIIVAAIGCLKGLQCGRSAAEVGRVTTSAVVTSIVWIIISCAIITVACYILDV